MNKELLTDDDDQWQRPAIEFWEDDCGLSDLARDEFAQLDRDSGPRKPDAA
jgi:hypothetical protein